MGNAICATEASLSFIFGSCFSCIEIWPAIFYDTLRELLYHLKGLIWLAGSKENLGKSPTVGINTREIALPKKALLARHLSEGVGFLRKDFIFFAFLVLLFLKSYLFVGVANNEGASSFSWTKLMYSFDAPPHESVYMAFLLPLLGIAFLLKGKLHFWYLCCLNGILSLLMIGDLMYYRGFGDFISPYIFSQTSNLENLFGSIVSMLRPIDVLFVLDLIVLLPAGKKVSAYYRQIKRSFCIFSFCCLLTVATLSYQHYRLDVRNPANSSLFFVDWAANQTMTHLSPTGYHLYDFYNYYTKNQAYEPTAGEVQEIAQWLYQNEECLPDNQFKGIFKGKNLLIVQVESLENFVINQKIDGQEITPNLNRLLKNSYYFSNMYEQVKDGNSSDADLMINTSVYPVTMGATFFRFPLNTYNSLPNLLEKKGYTSTAIDPEKGSYWNWLQALTAIGFDQTVDESYFKQDEKIGMGISDGSYFTQVAPLLAGKKQPFYTFMITLTSHSPFELPEQYQSLTLADPVKNTKLGGYFQCIHYTDREIGHFLEKLEQSHLLDNTVVAIYGDHTGVHKFYNDEVQQIDPGEMWWLDSSKRVPFLIYCKDLKGQKFTVTGGQIDIMPSLAYLFDLDPSYKKTALGRNLFNTKKNFAVLASREFVGTAADDSEKTFLVKGIDISELIIRSNYYKHQGF
jgi:lipoteichoic acid synthase